MAGSGVDGGGFTQNFLVQNGSGSAAAGTFNIGSFTGQITHAISPTFNIISTDNTTLSGSIDYSAVGRPTSGNYNISADSTGWANMDNGTAAGSRTQ